jgi:glutamate-ammonia-ligase adenylyltransferase
MEDCRIRLGPGSQFIIGYNVHMSLDIFADTHAASRSLARLASHAQAGEAFEALQPHLLTTLASSADPDRALTNFERFFTNSKDPAAVAQRLAGNQRAVEILVTLFTGSQFLSEILLRNPEYFDLFTHPSRLTKLQTSEKYTSQAMSTLSPGLSPVEQLDSLRRYQRGELLRIGASDLLNLVDLTAATRQLSNLADGLLQACLKICVQRTGIDPSGFTVLAFGKLGGQELNYSSDIDLLFLAKDEAGGYTFLGEQLIEALDSMTGEGFLYRVDMRLRPWGKDGALVSTVDGYLDYLAKHARLWEKQALLKARPVAGNIALGDEFLHRAQPLIFGTSVEMVRTSVYAMKQRTEEFLRQQGRFWGEVKLGEGSIRDVEFTVQFLQLAHGSTNRDIHTPTTLEAISRLTHAKLLTADEARTLSGGYVFLRTVEHYLQMMQNRQNNTLPSEPTALALLARRLGFTDTEQFLERYQQHGAAIRAVYLRRVGSEAMNPQPPSEIRQHMERMDAAYAITFSEADIQRHAALADQLSEDRLAVVEAEYLQDRRWRVTIVGYDYPGELSIICGLMFVHGWNVLDGEAFTYEESTGMDGAKLPARPSPVVDTRRKIVDVFTVQSILTEPPQAEIWSRYADDLIPLLKKMRAGQRREARGELAKRVGAAFQAMSETMTPLYPVDIEIDNEASDRYTVLRIDAPDTIGFLYEFTNALAFNNIYIARVVVQSVGSRAHDTLFVTDAAGHKITDPGRQRELRAATVLIKHFTHLLPHSPNPETALLHFREFLGQLFQRPNWPDELASMERSDVLHALAHVLGVSEFLWDDFLRMQYANLFPVVRDVDALSSAKTTAQLQSELEAKLAEPGDWRVTLNAFKDREMFRIDMRHLLGHTAEFWDFAAELTDLAELVVNVAFHYCYDELRLQYGSPVLEDGSPCPVVVLALGKCGGRELGFASDIDLMFVHRGNGQTTGQKVITTGEFFEKLVQSFVASIQSRQEGIFEIDLQLRPYGKTGSMAVMYDSFQRYYAPNGSAWAYERQALVQLRPVAGDASLGREIEALRDQYVYNGDPFDVTAMRAMRERQLRHLVTGGTFNAKYSPGGLVDVEYLIHGLQITHGAGNSALRLTNIRESMQALAEAGIISQDDYTRLRKAHTFLRWMIDAHRVVRGNSKDVTIPSYESEEFAFLARRLLYGSDVNRLRDDLARYTAEVQEINKRLLG